MQLTMSRPKIENRNDSRNNNDDKLAQPELPRCKILICAGTYDGVLAGWEMDNTKKTLTSNPTFKIAFASPVHGGSIRSLTIAATASSPETSSSPNKSALNSSNGNHRSDDKNDDDDNDNNEHDDDDNENNVKGENEKKDKRQQAITTINGNDTSSTLAPPGLLVSCGYDEVLKTHDLSKRLTSSGEVKTPNDYGTPVCSSFAPPFVANTTNRNNSSTHCIVGFSGGNIVIYKKRDWIVQHVLNGHEGGVAAIAVHPSGKVALSGGISDGKLKLWDLTKGRLAYVTKIKPASTAVQGRTRYDPIDSIVWSPDANGVAYAFSYGAHVTVKEVATGNDLLDVELPSKVNQITLLVGPEGMFVAAACNDGSLPVLAVQNIGSASGEQERRAIMAIEPVDTNPIAGEERFKCIQCVTGYYVVTANSAGVVSLMNLYGAIKMILSDDNNETSKSSRNKEKEETPVHSDSDEEDDEDDDDEDDDDSAEVDLAVDIIDSVRLGSGARITSLVSWCSPTVMFDDEDDNDDDEDDSSSVEDKEVEETPPLSSNDNDGTNKRKYERNMVRFEDGDPKRRNNNNDRVRIETMDDATLERARELVSKAKKIQKKKHKKNQPKQQQKQKSR